MTYPAVDMNEYSTARQLCDELDTSPSVLFAVAHALHCTFRQYANPDPDAPAPFVWAMHAPDVETFLARWPELTDKERRKMVNDFWRMGDNNG